MLPVTGTDPAGGDDDSRQCDVSPRVQTRVRTPAERIAASFGGVPPDFEVRSWREFEHSRSCHVGQAQRISRDLFLNQQICIP